MRDVIKGIVVSVVAIAALAVAFWIGLVAMKPILNAQTTNYRQTLGYVDARQSALLKLLEDYADLDAKIIEADDNASLRAAYRSQQLAIIRRVRDESAKLNPDQVPASVAAFIVKHKGE